MSSLAYHRDLREVTHNDSRTFNMQSQSQPQSITRTQSDTSSFAFSGQPLAPYGQETRKRPSEGFTDQRWMDGVEPMGRWTEVLFVMVLCATQFFFQAGLSMTIFPIQTIATTFRVANPPAFGWEVAAYAMAVGNFALPMGRLGDLWGHSRVFVLGLVWFTIWSLFTGGTSFLSTLRSATFAPSTYNTGYILFNIGRAMQGIGAIMVLNSGMAVASSTYRPSRRKDIVFGSINIMGAVGFVASALYSSVLAEKGSWQWTFFTFALLSLVVAVVGYFVLPAQKATDASTYASDHGKNRSGFDWLGTVTSVLGLVLINFSTTQGPIEEWENPYLYLVMGIGVVLVIMFVRVQAKASFPLVPVWLLRSKKMIMLMTIMGFGWAAFGIWLVFTTQMLSSVDHQAPVTEAIEFIPLGGFGILASLLIPLMMPRLGPSIVLLFSMIAYLISNILLATTQPQSNYFGNTFAGIIFASFGMNLSFPAVAIIAAENFSPEQQGTIGALMNTVINFAIGTGIGMGTTIQEKTNQGGKDLPAGIKSGSFLGISFAVLAVGFSLFNVYMNHSGSDKDANENGKVDYLEKGSHEEVTVVLRRDEANTWEKMRHDLGLAKGTWVLKSPMVGTFPRRLESV